MGQSRNEATTTVDGSVGFEAGEHECARAAAAQEKQSREWPLSFGQSRLWFLDQLEPGSALYNIPVGLRIKGPLNVLALQTAFDALIARHESLRTRFVAGGEEPTQIVEKRAAFRLESIAIEADSQTVRDEKAVRLLRQEMNAPFDLRAAPLVRAKLLEYGGQDHLLVVTIHHMVAD